MPSTNQDYQFFGATASDVKAIEKLLSYAVVDLTNEEMVERFFPSQEKLLDKLKQQGYSPEKIREMCLSEQNVPERLLRYGLEFSYLKQAGVTPSSVLGTRYICKSNGYLHSSEWESEITISDLFKGLGFTVKELLEDGFKEKDIPPKYLAAAGYSLKQLKKLGTSFNEIKKIFPLEEIINSSYDLKTLHCRGISAKNLINKYSYSELHSAGYSPHALQKAGADAKTMKEIGVSAKKLRRGFRFYDPIEGWERPICGAWFSIEELKEAGYTPSELKEAKISAKEMKEVGFSKKDLEGIFVRAHLDKVYSN